MIHQEQQSKDAFAIKEDFAEKRILISVPILLFYEVNNLLKTATKSLRIDEDRALDAYVNFLKLEFIVYATKKLFTDSLKLACKLDISSYDASYISLVEYLETPLYTADTKLIKKTGKNPLIKNLNDYKV